MQGERKQQSVTTTSNSKMSNNAIGIKLVSRPISACRYPDSKYYNLGWVKMLRPVPGFENFTYEFLSSFSFTKDRLKSDNPNHRVSLWLLNVDYDMSLEHFHNDLGLANAGYIHDSWDHTLKPGDYDPVADVVNPQVHGLLK